MQTKFNFTKTALLKLPTPEKGFVTYSDTEEKGLKLYVTETGTKSFFVRKMVKGRDQRFMIGDFPDLSVENARKAAQDMKYEIRKGKDPNEEKQKFRKESTLKELFNEYMERYSKKQKKSWQYDEREIPKFLSPWFGRKLSDITKQQVQKLHELIRDDNGLYQANRLLERLKSMYNRAIEWGWDGTNPCNGIKKYKEIKRERFIQPLEFKPFFEALEEEENIAAKNYIWISLLTGARRSNVLAMRWDEINFERNIWRIPETKNGDPQEVPLVKQAIDLLKVLKEESESEWVFPSPSSKTGHLQDPKKPWQRILKKAGIDDLRIHDIRRTLASYQTIMGTSLTIVGKSLGHKSSKATEIYAKLTLDPVRDSMQTATDKMLEYKKG